MMNGQSWHAWIWGLLCVAALWSGGCKGATEQGKPLAGASSSTSTPAGVSAAEAARAQRARLTAQHASSKYVGSESCRDCHADLFKAWQGSHHQLAMQEPSEESVLGEFANTQYRYFGELTRFRQKGGKYEVETEGVYRDGDEQKRGRRWFEVKYAFGVTPLQQYLADAGKGHLQTLPFTYDTRSKESGGQRWYHLYSDEHIKLDDPLHWSAPVQNWNVVCADCHSTDLQRRYNREQRRYETTYSEISVGCEACHGPAAAHVTQAKATPRAQFDEQKGFARSFSPQAERQWLFLEGKPIAQLVAGPKDSKASKVDAEALGAERATELSACAKCHALRGDLGGDSLEFDQRYRVELLEDVHYFADGQIQGEVYEHGSFLQSKMHAAGVSCSDCHEPHGGTLRAQGNQLCGRCHSAETFDTPKHHFHMGKGEATQCVSCHMPSRVYMGVDDRRDHRLGVPRPDLTLEIGVPNACTTACHTQPDGRRAALWAAGEIEKHFGKERPPSFARAIDAARRVAPGADRLLTEVINQRDFPAIARATALLELRNFPSEEPLLWEGYSKDESPLVRRALAQLVAGWPAPDRVPVARALLGDPVRTVRLEAVRGLLDGPRTGFSAAEETRFIQVRQELKDSLLANADQPGALLDLARMRLLEVGSVEGATKPDAEVEGLFREALALDPAFTPVYINFADYYRVTGRDDHAEVLLKTGIEQVSDPAQLEHALGLVLVRLNRPDAALAHLRRAHDLRPELPRFGFVYAVALFEQGKQRDAIAVLEKLHSRFEGELQVLDALIQYQRVVGNEARAAELLQKMPGAQGRSPR